MIKNIKVWKTIVLLLLTFGTYCWVWFAKRRNEVVKSYKVSIPHWGWFVIPHALTLPVATCIFLIPSAFYDPSHPLSLVIMPMLVLLLLSLAAVALWWTWQFAMAVEKITQGKISPGWIFLYIFVLGPAMLCVVQYYFNRLPKSLGIEPTKYKPSQKFVVSSVIAIFIAIAGWTVLTVAFGLLSIGAGQSEL